MNSITLPNIHALWIGEKLGNIARCCLKSFIKQGHQVVLHTYSHISDIPENIIVSDANKIISHERIIKHKRTGSYALFSDIFRYELLRKIEGDGIYVDCDVYCIRPMLQENYVLAFEDDYKINGAVLALPHNSIVLKNLLIAAYDPYFIPPWYSKTKQFRFKIKKIFGISRHISEMPWGIIGPEAITYYMKESNALSNVKPMDYYYPIHFHCISKLLDPALTLKDIVTHRTQCIHLYNEMLKDVDLLNIPNNCILSKMLDNSLELNKLDETNIKGNILN